MLQPSKEGLRLTRNSKFGAKYSFCASDTPDMCCRQYMLRRIIYECQTPFVYECQTPFVQTPFVTPFITFYI